MQPKVTVAQENHAEAQYAMEAGAYLTNQVDATEKFAKSLGTAKSIYEQPATSLPQQ